MSALGMILVLFGTFLFVAAIVAMFKPLKALRMTTRKAAVVGLCLGVASCVVGSGIYNSTPEGKKAKLEAEQKAKVDAAARETENAQREAARAEASKPLALGSAIQAGDAEIKVEQVLTRSRVGGEYIGENASEGGVLVVVKYSVKNIGTKPMPAYKRPDIGLIDANGVEYKPDAGKTAAFAAENTNDMKAWSDLNPGITTRGAEVFEVSAEQYDPATWSATVDGKRVALQ